MPNCARANRAVLSCARPTAMRRLALIVLVVLLAVGRPGAVASATRVVHAPHVDVLYDDPALAAYAQKVAGAAETELVRVAALFGRRPFPIRIRLQGGDDIFNAFALPLPRPHVTFRPLFPMGGVVGFHGADLTPGCSRASRRGWSPAWDRVAVSTTRAPVPCSGRSPPTERCPP
ncbi:MAG: hypothetical protein P8Y02_02485 [Deinococcales bacterium]